MAVEARQGSSGQSVARAPRHAARSRRADSVPQRVMRVTVLGSGDAFGAGGRFHSAYLAEVEGSTFLLDCGPSILQSAKRMSYDLGKLDAVLLTHLHGDHFGGIPFLFMEYRYESPRTRPLTIYGPEGTERRVKCLVHRALRADGSRAAAVPGRVSRARAGGDDPARDGVGHRGPRPSRAGADGVRLSCGGRGANVPLLRRHRVDRRAGGARARRRSLRLRVLHLRDAPRHPRVVSRDRGAGARARLSPPRAVASRQRAAQADRTSSAWSAPATG